MRSLKVRLFTLWSLSLLASLAVAVLLFQLTRQSSAAKVERAEAVIARACDLVRERFGFYAAGWTGSVALTDDRLRRDLATTVGLALARQNGVEGGIWQAEAGPLAYAYPTYEGTGPKTDLPVAERDQIQAVNAQAARDEQPAAARTVSRSQTLLLHACPLTGPINGLTAWTMTRVQTDGTTQPLQLGLAVLMALMTIMSVWLGWVMLAWNRHLNGIEAALADAGQGGMPRVGRTGERELDRIIDALNDAGARLAAVRREADVMAGRVARAERLAGLGRVAAGVAHEIRNPLAAARLQGENALAGDDARRRVAIEDMLGQIARLDTLAGELLAMTQRVQPRPEPVDLAGFLDGVVAGHRAVASARSVTIKVLAAGMAVLDPSVVGRIMDNLLANAIRHAGERGAVSIRATHSAEHLVITVEDSGPGVSPEVAGSLFEPFVTSRADGTGLGLAIARELADAHGGSLTLSSAGDAASEHGASFELELPQEDTCRSS